MSLQPIRWGRHAVTGAYMPLDWEPADLGPWVIDSRGRIHYRSRSPLPVPHHTAHFATCPNAAQHRNHPRRTP